jgi:hypothetical protein
MITGPLKSKIDKLWLEFWASSLTSSRVMSGQICETLPRVLCARD